MNIMTSLIVGVLLGWITSVMSKAAAREDLIRNLAVGIAGAFVGGRFLGSLFGSGQEGFSLGVMAASILGAATLLLLVTRLYRT